MIKILNRIIEYRKAKGLVQKQMADKLGIAQVNYGKIETGKTELTLDRLFKIADILEVSVIELINPDFNPANFSKELQEENINLKYQIEEKTLLIETLKNERAHIKDHLINVMVDDYSFELTLNGIAHSNAKTESEKEKLFKDKEEILKKFNKQKEYYIRTGFLAQSDFDNYYNDLKENYQNLNDSEKS